MTAPPPAGSTGAPGDDPEARADAGPPSPPTPDGVVPQPAPTLAHNGLGLTRAAFERLLEADLRTRVLVPLFRAMGFRDVDHYHGGAMEQGKDLVMWQPDSLGARVNYAVVAKAGRVSGKASGSGSAGEVATQVQQALADPFRDARTGAPEYVGTCWVVASGAIPKEARHAVLNGLGRGVSPTAVRFVDGDLLWSLIEAHLPAATALEKLADVRRLLAEAGASPDIVLQASRDGVQIIVGPPAGGPLPDTPMPGAPSRAVRSDVNAADGPPGHAADAATTGADPHRPGDARPGDVLRIAFRNDPQGREAAARLTAGLPSGEPVTVEGAAVQEVQWPAALAPLLGPGLTLHSLTVQPMHASGGPAAGGPRAAQPRSFLAFVEVAGASRGEGAGAVAALGPVLLRAGPPGAMAALVAGRPAAPVTFEADDPLLPWTLALTLDPGAGEIGLRFAPIYAGVNAKLAADALRFHDALHTGGVLRVRDARTGLTLFTGDAPPGAFAADPPPPVLLQYADALARIQARLNRPMEVPAAGPGTADEVLLALDTAQVLEAGETVRPFETVALNVDRQAAVRTLAAFADGAAHDLTNVGEERRTVAGLDVPLGRVAVVLPKVRVAAGEWAALRDRVAAAAEDAFIPITFTASDAGDPARAYYRDWIAPERVPPGVATLFDVDASEAGIGGAGRPPAEAPRPGAM